MDLIGLFSNHGVRATVDLLRRPAKPRQVDRPVAQAPPRRIRRLTDADVDVLVGAYVEGETLVRLAQHFGISRGTVASHLARRGVSTRRRGLTAEGVARAADLYQQGRSLSDLGSQFDVDASSVWRALRQAGVPLRPRPGREQAE